MEGTDIILTIAAAFSLVFYGYHMRVFSRGWRRLNYVGSTGNISPRTMVSVVVPARDEKDVIPLLMKDLEEQDYPVHLREILIVDDHSTDGTPEVVDDYIRQHDVKGIRLIRMGELGLPGSKKSAVEAALARAGGELVAMTDADCRLGKNWLKAFVDAYERSRALLLCGPVRIRPVGSFSGTFQELEFMSLVGSGAGAIGAGRPVFCNGASMAFSRQAFHKVEGYSGNRQFASGDDVFLLHKIKKHYGSEKIGFVLNPEAMVTTHARPGWKGFFRQRVRWASKTRGYSDIFALSTAISVFLINLVLFGLLITGIFYPFYLLVFGILLVMKMLIDLPIMMRITEFFDRRKLMRWFLPFEMIYIFYVLSAGVISLFHSGTWKNRKT